MLNDEIKKHKDPFPTDSMLKVEIEKKKTKSMKPR
jgi:hypothetical protein